ncbi:divalent-cation tolerance protein CutA [bacterium]|nr:divalent-cation tolerance protein CutA [bacterium]
MSFVIGYVTFKNKTQAKKICTQLVKNKLIACANILAPHTAIYEWEQKFVSTKEVAAIIKTTKKLSKKVTFEIEKMHSYETPCVVFWSISNGNPDFLKWLQQQTRSL